MSSVDGRLLPSRWTQPFDGTPSAELFKTYASLGKQLDTDAWMFGKSTTREAFPFKSLFNNKCYRQGGQSSRRFSLAMRVLWGSITTEEQVERCRRMAARKYYFHNN